MSKHTLASLNQQFYCRGVKDPDSNIALQEHKVSHCFAIVKIQMPADVTHEATFGSHLAMGEGSKARVTTGYCLMQAELPLPHSLPALRSIVHLGMVR